MCVDLKYAALRVVLLRKRQWQVQDFSLLDDNVFVRPSVQACLCGQRCCCSHSAVLRKQSACVSALDRECPSSGNHSSLEGEEE